MKNNRSGKAKVWIEPVIKKMRSELHSPQQRLIFEIGLCTGERIGAIVQLKVSDVFAADGKVLETITFAGSSRKSSKHGQAKTRQVFIHDHLRTLLEQYRHEAGGYLFPSSFSRTGHITTRAVDKYWRNILETAGYYGYSTHSNRRWVINKLRELGTEISIIAETLAISIATVRKYLDDDPIACKNAIQLLPV